MAKLTLPAIKAAVAVNADLFLWDESLPGFGIRVKPSGVKTFVAQYRNRSGRSRRMKLGRLGPLTLDEARKLALRILGEVSLGRDPAEERQREQRSSTFRELAERYMAKHCALRCKPSTVAANRWLLEKLIYARLGSRRVMDITPVDIQRLHQSLADKPYNANRALGLIRTLFNKAANFIDIVPEVNPAKGIDPFPEEERARRLETDEFSRLCEAIDTALEAEQLDPYAAAAFRLLLATGCRRSEILTLRWPMVDFQRRQIVFEQHKTDKKGNKKHVKKVIPLNDVAYELLWQLRDLSQMFNAVDDAAMNEVRHQIRAAEKRLRSLKAKRPRSAYQTAIEDLAENVKRLRRQRALYDRLKGNPYVIVGDASPTHLVDLKGAWDRIRSSARLQDFRLHDLRHSFASEGADLDLSLTKLGKLLGHSSLASTARYAHLKQNPLLAASELIGQSFRNAGLQSKLPITSLAAPPKSPMTAHDHPKALPRVIR